MAGSSPATTTESWAIPIKRWALKPLYPRFLRPPLNLMRPPHI